MRIVVGQGSCGIAAGAEKVLSAMLKRKGQKGCFTVTPAGIRSAFDPSYYMGTLGISYAMMEYLSIRSL